MAIVLTKSDCLELNKKLPNLNCELSNGVIWGTLDFKCCYDFDRCELVYVETGENYIQDAYEIRIVFNESDTFGFPKIYEPSGIIKEFAEASNLKLEDLHINKDNYDSCCLGIFPEYLWTSAWQFIIDKVIPFFYWQSYRRINGQEPWKGFTHGNDGIIEAMRYSVKDVFKGKTRNKLCPCGSGRKYKKCCLRRDMILKSKLKKLLPSAQSADKSGE